IVCDVKADRGTVLVDLDFEFGRRNLRIACFCDGRPRGQSEFRRRPLIGNFRCPLLELISPQGRGQVRVVVTLIDITIYARDDARQNGFESVDSRRYLPAEHTELPEAAPGEECPLLADIIEVDDRYRG